MMEPGTPTLLLTVEEAARELSIGRSLAYELVRRHRLPSLKIGRCRRIARLELERFIEAVQGQARQSSERSEESLNSA